MKSYKYEAPAAEHDLFLENGPLIPVALTGPVPLVQYLRKHGLPPFPTGSGYALIDTGAEFSAVDGETMAELGIPDVSDGWFLTTHGQQPLLTYNLSVNIPSIGLMGYPLKEVAGGTVRNRPVSGMPIIMLLGRDILKHLVFNYDGPNATVTLQG